MTESKSEDEVISHDGENMAAGSAPIRLYNCTNILPPFSSKSMPKSSLESTYKTYPSNDNDNKPPSAPSSLPLDTTPSSDNLLAKSAQLLNCAWIPGQVSHANSIELQKFIDFIDCFPPGTDDAVVLKATYEALNTQQGKTWFRQAECTVGMLKRELVEALGADVRCATTNAYVTEILEFRQKQLAQKKGVGNPNFDGTAEAVRRLQEHMLEDLEEARKLVAGSSITPVSAVPSTLTRRLYGGRPAVMGLKKRAFRIAKVSCSYEAEGERVKTDWNCRGVFVVLEEDLSLQALEKALIEGVKEQDPKNVGILEKSLKVTFWETEGPLITERVWEGVREMVKDLEAEIVF